MQGEVHSEPDFDGIIGQSPVLKAVLTLARKMAASDTPVLILGEGGSGKESIARAIHRISSRRNDSFVKVNCATTAEGRLENELFGREKGSSDNALSRTTGRLELANKGTLFLHEIERVPLDLQPRLLRVLKGGEFEPLGSTRRIRVNVRWIASSRHDLAKRGLHRFREDLYEQLKAAPLQVPSLRERRDDIPLLVRYFVQKFARRMNKRIATVPTETMNVLMKSDWPGNVTELEGFVERAVILTEGSTLHASWRILG
jgi:formate hydrogenlyase transcriptional activator